MKRSRPGPAARWLHTGLLALACLCAWPAAWSAQALRWSQGSTPALAFETLDGRPFESAALKGRVVVLNFWAVWCAPCREEIPLLEQMAASMAAQPVSFVLVNTGDSPAALAKLRRQLGASLTSLRLPAQSQDYRFTSLPATVVLDASGRARWIINGAIDAQGEPVRSLVAGLLAEAAAQAAKTPASAGN